MIPSRADIKVNLNKSAAILGKIHPSYTHVVRCYKGSSKGPHTTALAEIQLSS